jgi:riboflavin synthase alpha subunit
MFTGLIEETGTIISTEIRGTSRRIRIKAQTACLSCSAF